MSTALRKFIPGWLTVVEPFGSSWRALPHGPIERLSESVWRVVGTLDGVSLRRVMTIVQVVPGNILVHSAVALDEAAMKEIEAWGEVRWVVVPNGFHRTDAAAFKARYPRAKFVCPLGARKRVEQVTAVDEVYGTWEPGPGLRMEALDGTREREGVLIVREPGGATLVFGDAVFNMPHQPGVMGWALRHVTQSSGGPRVSRLFRWVTVADGAAFRAHLLRLADLPDLRRIIVAHHELIHEAPSAVLRQVAAG